jgi:hypothetical protein
MTLLAVLPIMDVWRSSEAFVSATQSSTSLAIVIKVAKMFTKNSETPVNVT